MSMHSDNYSLSTNHCKLVAIVGQTASGKSALAMNIAKEFNGEIICADSWTVYKGFDIGTSKPSQADQKAVKHWLLDVRQPNQGFNAPVFKELSQEAIADIRSRGKLPILAGGTGLYIDSILYDFGFLDSVSPHAREDLNDMPLENLLALARKDKIDLSGIDVRNKRRVIRAIESGGLKPTKGKLMAGTVIIGLQPDDSDLKNRAEQRVNQMLAQGLEQEVKQLSKKYGWDTEPMKGIGYKEWQAYFAGTQDLDQTRQRIISATNNLAKRQRTWFKRNPDIQWFSSANDARSYVYKILNKQVSG